MKAKSKDDLRLTMMMTEKTISEEGGAHSVQVQGVSLH